MTPVPGRGGRMRNYTIRGLRLMIPTLFLKGVVFPGIRPIPGVFTRQRHSMLEQVVSRLTRLLPIA